MDDFSKLLLAVILVFIFLFATLLISAFLGSTLEFVARWIRKQFESEGKR